MMKVLIVAPYLYNADLKAFTKNKTGFGILLDQMTEHIGNHCELYFFSNVITPEITHYNAKILKHTWWDMLRNMSFKDLLLGLKNATESKQRLRDRVLYVYYHINCGCLRKAIKQIRPDIIHCHGVGEKYMYYIKTCIASDIPVIDTLHGLIGLSESIIAYPEDKASELEYLKCAERDGIATTVISTGILNRIRDEYKIQNTDFITVISNGTSVHRGEQKINIREKYNIPPDNKILIAVGSVCEGKNQIQIVRSFALLPKEMQDKTTLFILGTIAEGYEIQEEISRLGLENKVICCGFVEADLIGSYYMEAEINILASVDEGFGLSMIEGFVYGVPCVTFGDLDAVPDIYDDKAMLLCAERTDEALAKVIEVAMGRQWDTDWIIRYSKGFSLGNMAEQYINLYQKVVLKHVQ